MGGPKKEKSSMNAERKRVGRKKTLVLIKKSYNKEEKTIKKAKTI